MDTKAIGKRIQDLRLSTKTSKEALSIYLDITEAKLADIEDGKVDSLDLDIIEKLADLYFCPVEYILSGKNKIENRVNFNYEGFSTEKLANMAKIFKVTRNQAEIDKISENAKISSSKTKDIYDGLSAEEIRKQRWTGLKVSSGKPSKQTYTDTSEEDIETREEKEQREFEETQWDEYFFNDFNPYGL